MTVSNTGQRYAPSKVKLQYGLTFINASVNLCLFHCMYSFRRETTGVYTSHYHNAEQLHVGAYSSDVLC